MNDGKFPKCSTWGCDYRAAVEEPGFFGWKPKCWRCASRSQYLDISPVSDKTLKCSYGKRNEYGLPIVCGKTAVFVRYQEGLCEDCTGIRLIRKEISKEA